MQNFMRFLFLMIVTSYWQAFSLGTHQVKGDMYYVNSVISVLDCETGKNSFLSCNVKAFGRHGVDNNHNKSSGADGIVEPVPDFLVGSPQLCKITNCGTKVGRSPFYAKSCNGLERSYSIREIAIHSKAPLVCFEGGFEALMTRNLKAPNRASLNAVPIEC
jgi:endoglucanase